MEKINGVEYYEKEEAKEMLKKKLSDRCDVWCPIVGGSCNTKCECLFKGSILPAWFYIDITGALCEEKSHSVNDLRKNNCFSIAIPKCQNKMIKM